MQFITQQRWYCANVGDSRAYELYGNARQLTIDHSFVEREVSCGRMTREEADVSPKKNMLTQCVGIDKNACPDMFFGATRPNTAYLLCSDGFRHHVKAVEIYETLMAAGAVYYEELGRRVEYLIDLSKRRGETDNISAAVILTVGTPDETNDETELL